MSVFLIWECTKCNCNYFLTAVICKISQNRGQPWKSLCKQIVPNLIKIKAIYFLAEINRAASIFTIFIYFYNVESNKTVDSMFDLLVLHLVNSVSCISECQWTFYPKLLYNCGKSLKERKASLFYAIIAKVQMYLRLQEAGIIFPNTALQSLLLTYRIFFF